MNETPSYVSQPQVIDLPKLLADVRAGHIQVPRFQRPFVWEDERRVELLRSLRAGIPIGSLLVWRTSQNRLPSFDAIAGVKIPRPIKGQTISYLLDGHQRLTTLFAAFLMPAPHKRGKAGSSGYDDVPTPIFFDLEQDDFVVGNPTDAWSCLPLHLFLDAVGIRQHFRNKEREGGLDANEVDRLQEIAEGVLYAMQWCRIPVIPLSTDDVELATRTFHRVNSQGVAMTEFHMVAALTWGDEFDLREIFEREWSKQSLPDGWEPASEQQTLNVLKGLLGMDVVRSPGDLLVRRIKEKPELAIRPVELLARAMTLAAENFVHSPVAVPYQMQLTLTAIALDDLSGKRQPDPEWLRRWWGLTTVWGSFASAATHRVQAALRHLRAGLSGKPNAWPKLLYATAAPSALPSLDLRNARARYFADGYAFGCNKVELLHSRGPRAIVSLIPGEGTRPGNRFIWPGEDIEGLFEALNTENREALHGHFIEDDCLSAWRKSDMPAFIARREKAMNAFEGRWFSGLHPKEFITGADALPSTAKELQPRPLTRRRP
ncbi:DUF262 domain-containing protein [Paucibacter sp. DJ2R-2]|uniref:DUF262 domain-containing protein n=1 Tax=Paucibacter sp. DJ2R-2 TaxID=2893558 RepID=UPI0021E4F48D|nr:DUF262 domain-containing protein [Paucibacter sp. DJ2R-2]MCV2419091.1 DUF262 domain-containing protein [Paucibacter sp. DJ4R-1]MCV2437954.1 DUF262 domain-containing protein [Paucibacter sp. DJ2R-2]